CQRVPACERPDRHSRCFCGCFGSVDALQMRDGNGRDANRGHPLIRSSITVKRFHAIGVSLGILATLTAVVAVALTLFVPVVRADAGGTEVFHGQIHPIRGAGGQAVTNSLMTYHGGPISAAPVVYINYWGSLWNTGFSTGGYTSAQAQTYVNGFFGNVGGSS